MIAASDIKAVLCGNSLVGEIDRVGQRLRCETAFLYPDGSSVDVFVWETDPLFPRLLLSDLGQTVTWLLDMQVKPWQSKRRQQLLQDAIQLYGVRQAGGALELPIESRAELVSGIIRLGQACVRVADLFYTRKSNLQTNFSEEVEEFFSDVALPYDIDCELEGRGGRRVKVDFVVRNKLDSMVLTLAPGHSAHQAHTASNEVFRKWYDLSGRPEQRVTVFDDRIDAYRNEDLERIREQSDLIGISDPKTLYELLAA
ncbi:DUF1828 domain-containing protein [Nannocystis punicea]|uniref:DUF1828 domain-containing protein n=1 Tax=Nannocystis punicea TaxID=2995304 RepID=A0ABY7H229_9BACT|nr:DUF1828 domain-containing protein [Nannocystis poenicansa]WAS93278.1 DUF1828 domain-containing protein [Nannocystis poenicansa]